VLLFQLILVVKTQQYGLLERNLVSVLLKIKWDFKNEKGNMRCKQE